MKKKKIYIVEDDPIIASDLKGILEDNGYEVCGVAHQPVEAKKQIERIHPDLVLLDIHLNNELDGVDLASMIRNHGFPFVFISAHSDKTTLERVKPLHPVGYILKPFNDKEIAVQLEIIFSNMQIAPGAAKQPVSVESNSIFIKSKNSSMIKIRFDEIILMEAFDNYAYIHLTDERHIVNFTLKELEQKIQSPDFLRVHRSFIVNTKHVEAIHQMDLIMGKHKIPIGKSYREETLKHFPTL